MASWFHNLQQEIADRLAADPFFEQLPCLWELKKDIESEIEHAVSTIGGGLVVVTPTASVDSGNLPGPWYDDIGVVIQCYNDPTTGSELPRSMEIAEKVAAILHHWQPASLSTPLVADKPTIVPAQTDNPNADGRDVRFRCSGGIAYEIPQVATPAAVEDAGEVTITCSTPGAALFYRLDDRRPAPRGGTLYTAPFTPATGTKVRVRAFLAGYLVSDEVTLTVP